MFQIFCNLFQELVYSFSAYLESILSNFLYFQVFFARCQSHPWLEHNKHAVWISETVTCTMDNFMFLKSKRKKYFRCYLYPLTMQYDHCILSALCNVYRLFYYYIIIHIYLIVIQLYTQQSVYTYCYLYTLYLYIMDMKRKVRGLCLTLLYIIYRWLAHSKNLIHVLWCLICWYHLTVGLIQEATVAGWCPDSRWNLGSLIIYTTRLDYVLNVRKTFPHECLLECCKVIVISAHLTT